VKLKIAGLAIVSFALLVLLTLTKSRTTIQEPFSADRWRASSSEARWAIDRPRYRMREGAVGAAQQCRDLGEVRSVLGDPDEENLGKPDRWVYDLGAFPHPIWFWKRGRYVTLEVGMAEGKVNAGVVVKPSTSPGDAL
jgi:hypothetical protein